MKTRNMMAVLGLILLGVIVTPAVAQNAVPASARAAAGTTPEQNYILGPEDVLQVDALGRTDFSTKAKIGSDGTIQLPFLGTVAASNKSNVVLVTLPILNVLSFTLVPAGPMTESMVTVAPLARPCGATGVMVTGVVLLTFARL